jgi:4'-phosphopantetheinyl transferase
MAGHLTDKQDSHNSPLGANDLHIWFIRTPSEALPADLSPLQTCLSAHEHDRYQRLQRPDIRQHFLLSRGCLRYVLSIYLNCPPLALNFSLGRYGKPELKADSPPLQFNLSHTQESIAIALHSHNPVGIDIERVRPITHLEKLCQRCLTYEEAATVLNLDRPSAIHRFFQYWTAKEAIVKAMGMGLSYPMKHVEVFLETGHLTNQPATIPMAQPSHPHPSALLDSAPVLDGYRLYQWQPEANGIAAVAIQDAIAGTPPAIKQYETTPLELLERFF